jgi:hypothetical protein
MGVGRRAQARRYGVATSRSNTTASELLRGCVDPHIHSGPSAAARGLDHVELLRLASAAGYRAVVTKDHDYSGVATAELVRKNFSELSTQIFSGIVLNNTVGGFNPYAVEHTASMGGKIVWMPTLAAENHIRWQRTAHFAHPGVGNGSRPAMPLSVLNPDRSLRDDVKEILDIVARTAMTLAAGHLHVGEIWTLFEEAKKRGVERLIVNHPEEVIGASLEDVAGLAALGAYIEHSMGLFVEGSKFKIFSEDDLRKQIDAAGVDRTILCSDLGQAGTVNPIDGMRQAIDMCLRLGYTEAEIRTITSENAVRLLDLDVP